MRKTQAEYSRIYRERHPEITALAAKNRRERIGAASPAEIIAYCLRADVQKRFWAAVDRRTDTECWPWLKAHCDSYGRFSVMGVNYRATAISLMMVGIPVEHGQFVCHRCDNPPCVNPAHLFLGDHAINNRDRANKGRSPVADNHWSHRNPEKVAKGEKKGKLTEAQVLEIRAIAQTGVPHWKIAQQFGIVRQQVDRIVSRQRWAWLQEKPTFSGRSQIT